MRLLRWSIALGVLAMASACSLLLSYDEYDRDYGKQDGSSMDAGDAASMDSAMDACPPAPTCDADLQTDPQNCGFCGHTCLPLGAKCASSECAIVDSVTLSWVGVSPRGIAVDSTYAYLVGTASVNDGGAGRFRKNDLSGTVLSEFSNDPRRVIAHGTDLYWSQQGSIARAPNDTLPDGGPTTAAIFVANQASPWSLAADATYLFWTNAPGGQVWRAPFATGAAEMIAMDAAAYGIAVDAAFVYWTSRVQGGAVWRANKDGTMPMKLADNQSFPADLVVDDTAIYWTNNSVSDGAVMKLDKGATTPVMLAGKRQLPSRIAVQSGMEGTVVYWIENGQSQQDLMRMSLCNGSPLRLISNTAASDLAVDSTHVYWVPGNPFLQGMARVAR